MDSRSKNALRAAACAAGGFMAAELAVFAAAFAGRCEKDFSKNDFSSRPELKKYADKILAGQRYIRETPHETVEIRARDGVRLSGRLYDHPDRRGTVIMCHGYRSMAENDFSCSAAYVHSLGFAMLIIDQRAHGKSGGLTVTFGVREHWDVIDWAKYIEGRFPGGKIILEGLSMGASTVVMAAGEELPESVAGVIADCGYTSPREIIRSVIRSAGLPPGPLMPLVRLAARIYGGFDLDGCSAREAAARATVPALFIHGEADDFVPCSMGCENFEAWAGEKELVTVPGAGHGLSYVVDMPKCQEAMVRFLRKVMG